MADEKKGGIFAALGAATGLGNAFRFPALCAQYGSAFIVAYALSVAVVCYPLLCAELSFGRKAHKCGGRVWLIISRAAAANSALISLYYGLIAAKLGGGCLSFIVKGNAVQSTVFALVAALPLFCVAYFVLKGERQAASGKLSVILSLATFLPLAVCGVARGGLPMMDFSRLVCGAVWSDALGQALLSLSLAACVMPSFAKKLPNGVSVKVTALKIVCANLLGCAVAMLATLPYIDDFPAQGGVNAAFAIYPQIISAFACPPVVRRALGAAVFFTLTAVAVHSFCSLASPVLSFIKRGNAPLALCISSALLSPLFCLCGGEVTSCCDMAACCVTAVVVAFFESLYFAANKKQRGAAGFLLKFVCPLACGALAFISLSSARFSLYPPLANLCAFAYILAVPVFSSCCLVPVLLRNMRARRLLPKNK